MWIYILYLCICPDAIGHKCLVTWPTSCVFINDFIIPPADSSPGTSKCLAEQMAPLLWPDRMKSCALLNKKTKTFSIGKNLLRPRPQTFPLM